MEMDSFKEKKRENTRKEKVEIEALKKEGADEGSWREKVLRRKLVLQEKNENGGCEEK